LRKHFFKTVDLYKFIGLAVSYIAGFYQIDIRHIWVIHDDIDLPFAKLRIRRGGASAGHNGIESMIKDLKSEDFVRFRIGIGGNRKGRSKKKEICINAK